MGQWSSYTRHHESFHHRRPCGCCLRGGRSLHHRPGARRPDQRGRHHLHHLPRWPQGPRVRRPVRWRAPGGCHHPQAVVAAHTPVVSAVHGYGLPYAGYGGVVYGKREAEAEPWTVAQVALGAHVANAAAEGRAPGVITNAAIAPATHVVAGYAAPYAYAGYPYAHAGVYYGKREAEADPAVVAVSPYALHHGVYSTGLIGGVAGSNPVHAVAATPFCLTHSSNVGICTNYVGAQVPCAGRKKREADAQYLPYAGVYSGVYPTVYASVHGTNPVHAVAHTAAGLTHSSNVGICTNYLGAVVPC